MNNAEYSFTLDLQSVQSQTTLEVNSGDTARRLLIVLTNGGKTHKLAEGSMAVLSAKKSNGKYLFNKCSIINDNTTIRYDFTTATTDTPGLMQCELLIADPTEKTVISPRFMLMVDDVINGDEIWSEDENLFITQAVAQESAREKAEEKRVSAENARVIAEGFRKADYRRIESRVENLESAAKGNLYKTTEITDASKSIQLPNALPYGILSRLGGGVKKIVLALPFTLDRDTINLSKISQNSFTVAAARMPFFPCNISTSTSVAVYCDSEKNTVNGYGLSTNNATSGIIGGKNALGTSVNPSGDIKYITLYRTSSAPADTVTNLRVEFNQPDNAVLETLLKETVIPDAITSLNGYSEGYLKPTEREFHKADGTIVNVSEHLDEMSDVIDLFPGAIIRFFGVNGEVVTANYSLTYKNKL